MSDADAEPEEEPSWGAAEPLPALVEADDVPTIRRLQRAYAGAVTALDASLERLIKDAEKGGLGDRTVWMLTADRGFPLGEHGAVGYAHAELSEELVHLPLLVRLFDRAEAGLRVGGLTQPEDVGAWLRELFGVPPSGPSGLGPLMRGESTGRDRIVMRWVTGHGPEWAVRTPDWFLRAGTAGEAALFEKPADRWEVNDVRTHHLELADELTQAARG
jgi:arylsulfatase A-like enzyme